MGTKVTVKPKLIKFSELWKNYPGDENRHVDPKTGKPPASLANHCAMDLSEALLRTGVSLRKYSYDKCWCCPSGHNNTHAIRAAELAKWLKKQPFKGCSKPIALTGKTYKKELNNRKGIIYFEDYWQRAVEQGTDRRTGDHIDLWDDGELASEGTVVSFITQTMGLHYDGWYSDHELSKSVLFWEFT